MSLKLLLFVRLFEVVFTARVFNDTKDNLISTEKEDDLQMSLTLQDVTKSIVKLDFFTSFATTRSSKSKWGNELHLVLVIPDSLKQRNVYERQDFGNKKTSYTNSRNSAFVLSAPVSNYIEALSKVAVNLGTMNTTFEEGVTRQCNASPLTSSDFGLNLFSPVCSVNSSPTQFCESISCDGNETKAIINTRWSCYCSGTMDNVLEVLLDSSGSTRAHSYFAYFSILIPAYFATRWFYYGQMDDSDVEYAKSHFHSQYFVCAINIHSSHQHAIFEAKPDHWLFFSRGSDGMLHVYDSYGNEEYYKKILRSDFEKFWRKFMGKSRQHRFNGDNCNLNEKNKHPIQQDCGPLVLQESERWINSCTNGILTDADSCMLYRRRFNSVLQSTRSSASGYHGEIYNCYKSNCSIFEMNNNKTAVFTETEDVVDESVKQVAYFNIISCPYQREQKDSLDQGFIKSKCLRQQDVCNSRSLETNGTASNSSNLSVAICYPESNCINNAFSTELADNRRNVNAIVAGGRIESEIVPTATTSYGSNISSHIFQPYFGEVIDLWNYWHSFGPIRFQQYRKSHYYKDRIEAVVNHGHFLVSTSHLLKMESEWYCNKTMDNALELFLRQPGLKRASRVIPAHLSSIWFYPGKTSVREEVDACLYFSEYFITAINVHSHPENAASDLIPPDHWILFCRGRCGVLHLYDPYGQEEHYKNIVLPRFREYWRTMTGQLIHHVFDDDSWNNMNRQHPIQQDGSNCGPLCLREAERWLNDLTEVVLTDPASCASYRRRFANLFLQSNDRGELMNYCVSCNDYIRFKPAKCDRCHRHMHHNESCAFINATQRACYSCRFVIIEEEGRNARDVL